MEAATVAPPPAANGVVAAAKPLITMDEVEKHDTAASAWFVHEGKVYDATPFLKDHPGGADSILLVSGTDATDEFNSIHSRKAKDMLLQYHIGDLAPDGTQVHPGLVLNDSSLHAGLVLNDSGLHGEQVLKDTLLQYHSAMLTLGG
jgi:cytochrome b involved in lipid metabolism